MSKKRSRSARRRRHLTLLYMHSVYDQNGRFPYLYRHESDESLSAEIVDALKGSTPSARYKSTVALPGYRQEDGDWDEAVWIPMDLYEVGGALRYDSPITIIHAWIDE